jgi:hypothetical protein
MTNCKVGEIVYLKDVSIFGNETASFFAKKYDVDRDTPYFEKNFRLWSEYRESCLDVDGRAPNLSDGFTEGMFCLATGSVRYQNLTSEKKKELGFFRCAQKLSNSSIDTYNPERGEGEQQKSTIMDYDCSSFGPNSKQDVIYFMHFYRGGNALDGSFDLYRIENDVLQSTIIKEDGTTFADKKTTGQRPHFCLIKKVIEPNNIKPIRTNVKLW